MHNFVEKLKGQLEKEFDVQLRLVIGDEKFGIFRDIDDNPVHFTMRGWKIDFIGIPIYSKDYAPYVVNIMHIKKD